MINKAVKDNKTIEVNILSTDEPNIVQQKLERAIEQFENPIEGEYKVINDKRQEPAVLDNQSPLDNHQE